MDLALETARQKDGPVFTQGPLIHNTQATDFLRSRGIKIADENNLPAAGTLIIRAHGVSPALYQKLAESGLEIIDATCPHVVASQKRIQKYSAEGYEIILAGDPNHPEMQGLAGHATTPVYQISSVEDAQNVHPAGKVILIAQTTFHQKLYAEITDVLKQRFPDIVVFNSICNATEERQNEARHLAEGADALVVVGGKHSANTTRLAEIGRQTGKPTFHIETSEELNPDDFKHIHTVAVTAGASTPGWITEQVISRLSCINEQGASGRVKMCLRWLVQSYAFTAIGTIFLTLAIGAMVKNPFPRWFALVMTATYVFTAYVFNRKSPANVPQENLSPTDRFLRKNRFTLKLAATLSLAICLLCAWQLSQNALEGLAIACAGAIIYSIRILPHRFRYRRIKDLPASKDLFVAAAWACVLSGAVAVSGEQASEWEGMLLSAIPVFILILSRTILLDLHDIDGDRMIGRETLPVLLGKQNALRLAFGLETILFLYLATLYLLRYTMIRSDFTLLLCILPVWGVILLLRARPVRVMSDIRNLVWTDTRLYLAGLIWLLGIFL